VTWGRATSDGYEAFPDRAAIMAGALHGQGLELVYLEDPVDAFFIHIQGSARLAMTDGSVQRINFAGKSGHAYTPIGRTLVERGDMALEDVTMDSLRAWLAAASPADRDVVLATNRSYIFFAMAEDFDPEAGPVAAAPFH
jgi:membrane-bound lytic murein transglycosylase A